MSLLKGFVAVAVLAAFLAGAVVNSYVRPQPAAAMSAGEVKSLPITQDQVSDAQLSRVYQTNTADYVTRARPVRYIERAPSGRVISERYIPARDTVVVHRKRTLKKEALIVGGGAAAGAAIGAAAHGGRGAAVGALAGGIAGLAYDLATRNH